jgi:hypothetical protein
MTTFTQTTPRKRPRSAAEIERMRRAIADNLDGQAFRARFGTTRKHGIEIVKRRDAKGGAA